MEKNQVLKISRRKIDKKVAFLSDLQIPFQHDKAVSVALEIMKEEKPDVIVLGGDIIDFYLVSSFTIDKTAHKITDELSELYEFLHNIRKTFTRTEIIFIEGNHEERFFRYILKKADILAPLLNYNLSPIALFQLEKFRIRYVNRPHRIGKLYYLHGHEVKTTGQLVHIALTILRKLNRSFICGHFHRFQFFPVKEIDDSIKAGFINGCLFDIEKMPTPYEKIDLNQLGFSLIYYSGDFFHWLPVIFIPDGKQFRIFYDNKCLIA